MTIKKFFREPVLLLTVLLLFFCSSYALAKELVSLTGVRFGDLPERDRIVFDVSSVPTFSVREEEDGKRILIELGGTADGVDEKPKIKSEMIKKVSYRAEEGSLLVIIDLAEAAGYDVQSLRSPDRVFIDIKKSYEREMRSSPAPGLWLTTYTRRDRRGPLSAYLLEVDLKKYQLVPVLANGEILGRDTVRHMAGEVGALAAINSSYFEPNGEILGVLKMENTIVGTTYFTRSALGIGKNGVPFVEPVYYTGYVKVGRKTLAVSGVNVERAKDALVVYNRYYNTHTGTNEHGIELTVEKGRVTKISREGNSEIPEDGYVISAHGKSRDALARSRLGAVAELAEDLGKRWETATTVVGAGPSLVRSGRVHVTAAEEKFPDDIARGRAPRTGVAVLPDHRVLLAVVDGRQASSIGATLTEFAELLLKFGARDAVNFDGGGSSEMVIGGDVINSPSDGAERRVGSALAVMKK